MTASGYARRRHRALRRNGHGRPLWLMFAMAGLAAAVIGGAVIASVGMVVYQSYASDLVPPEEAINQLPSGGAKIYDRNGKLLYEFVDDLSGLRQPVPLSEVSPWFIAATISTEDASFWTNPGVNVRGLARAAWENFFPGRLGFLQGSGGSSITQQLVKNVYIPPEERTKRSIDRKLRETVYAIELTRKYDKAQILEWYVNQISYGGIYNGVEAASLGYFGKQAKDLDLAEAALLAGIPACPSCYDPIANPQAAIERRNQVLTLMLEHGPRIQVGPDEYITITPEQVYLSAVSPLNVSRRSFPVLAPHWVFEYIKPRVEELYGEEALYRGGLQIYTTLDLDLQRKAEEIVNKWVSEFEASSGGHNGALVAIDPNTMEILAYVGSRDYFNEEIQGQNDNAQAWNSPGSSLKPFTYATAFQELGWGPGTMILDTPISYPDADGRTFTPRNPAGNFQGPITVRNALGNSLNVPAFKTILYVGVDRVVQQMERMGIRFPPNQALGPSLTIGGVDVRLADVTFAYTVFPNLGKLRGVATPSGQLEPVSILRIVDGNGEVIWPVTDDHEVRLSERQVLDPQNAYLITSILSDPNAHCLTYGCGALTIDRPMAVKTGTSEPYENSRAIGDTWTYAYTPHIVVGAWAGNADNSPMYNITSTSISYRTARDMVIAVEQNFPPTPFQKPEGIVENVEVCVPSGMKVDKECGKTSPPDLMARQNLPKEDDTWWQAVKIDIRTGLRATAQTPPRFVQERFGLVIPDNLPPFWKTQAQEWARVLGSAAMAAPSEPSGGLIPVDIRSPAHGSTLRGEVSVVGRAQSDGFVAYRLEFTTGDPPNRFGWTLITRSETPVADGVLGVWDTSDLPPGAYTLRLVIEDRVRGELSTFVGVRVKRDRGNGEDDREATPTPEP